jgi:NADH-quinone oxidoreductase subunit G
MIRLTINQQPVTAQAGETILEAARNSGLYIPTLCYLSKVSAIGSCRLCVVEVEGQEGFVLSCQTPVREGIVVQTDSPALFKERQRIMALYNVNHPLECGVCDKSGECDLQNKTTEFQLSNQPFAAKEMHRPIEQWGGFIQYDPSLCILCERCVRVCNEVVGDNALAIEPGGYKSKISWQKHADESCAACGECMAVCPVGALVSTHFKNRANAWEMDRIPATCAHCSAGCQLEYEVRHSGTQQGSKRAVYRVGNDVDQSSLCAAGRFGYGFEREGGDRSEGMMGRALEAFAQAKSIRFSAQISNEEAYLLQSLKTRRGVQLVCDEAYGFARFLRHYSQSAGESLYDATTEDVAQSDAVVLFGCTVADEAPMVRSALNRAVMNRAASVAYLHPVDDPRLSRVVSHTVRYEVGAEEGVAALLLKALLPQTDLPQGLKEWLEALDEGYLGAESNLSEEEIASLAATLKAAPKRTLVVGADLYNHPCAETIASLVGLLRRFGGFSVLMVSPATNALGVSLICDLDAEATGYTVGIDQPGDFTLGSVLSDVDMVLPALSQQEGTITALDKRVLPLNVAVPWHGWSLGDIFVRMGMDLEWLIDLTPQLPGGRGYQAIDFDTLRSSNPVGYDLPVSQLEVPDPEPKPVAELGEFNGTVVAYQNPASHPTRRVMRCEPLQREGVLRGSAQFALAARIADGQRVRVQAAGAVFERTFVLDSALKGTVAQFESFDLPPGYGLEGGYRYERVQIETGGAGA